MVKKYLDCIEEIINIPELLQRFDHVLNQGYSRELISEIILQSKLEFNLETEN